MSSLFQLGTALLLFACDGGDFADPGGWGAVTKIYGGTDGTSGFSAPVLFFTNGNGDATFTVENTAVASIAKTQGLRKGEDSAMGVTVKAQSAGTTRITGKVAGKSFDLPFEVIAYTPADVALGQQRYNSPSNPNATDRRSCAGCHDNTQSHSTTFIARLTDADIVNTAVSGVAVNYLDPETGNVVASYRPLNGTHMFNVTAQEQKGIVAYLRSRPPTFLELF